MLMAIEPLQSLLLPVDNMGGNTPRENLRNIRRHLEADGALIIFPAGEVSRMSPKGVRDGEWQAGFVKIAAGAKAPILPVFVKARNSIFFYSLSFLAKPLSTAWLIREMFKHSHNTVDARVGKAVPEEVYNASDFSAKKVASMFRKHLYRLSKGGKPVFQTVDTIAPEENRVLLQQELDASELLGETADGKQIFLTNLDAAPCVMREIGRLRELTFRMIGEGTGLPRDVDRYDRYYQQLVLWDQNDREIVGAYRMGDAREITKRHGQEGLYTSSLFDFGANMQQYFDNGLELGRSFVQPKYQTRHSLDYLWYGIGAYVRKHSHCRYLFGPASISRFYGTHALGLLAWYYDHYYNALPVTVSPKTPFEPNREAVQCISTQFAGDDLEGDFKQLRELLGENGLPVPTLYKHYSQAADASGVIFTAFNVDKDFGDCVDGFVMVDLEQLLPKKRKRYIGDAEPAQAQNLAVNETVSETREVA